MIAKVIIGIDLAGKPENPTGFASLEKDFVETSLLYTDSQILENAFRSRPELIAIDAPLNLPKSQMLRIADKEMIKRGYRVFPPTLLAMNTLTIRAMELNRLIMAKGAKTIEVHPTSSCKALSIPPKEWRKIQTVLMQIGLRGEIASETLTPHEIDAVIAALTGHLYTQCKTESLGDMEEGYIIIPKKQDWRILKI